MASTAIDPGVGASSAGNTSQQFPPGSITPAEGPVNQKDQQQLSSDQRKAQLKPNMTNLEELFPQAVAALRELNMSYRIEGIVSRRWEAMRIKLAHLYWMGLQNGYYNPADWQIHFPFGTNVGLGLGVDDGEDQYEAPEFDYVTNYYQAYGLDYMALMSAKVPTPKFYPQSAQSERDITTAKAADDVRKLNEKNNSAKGFAQKYAWLTWCDGKVGCYTRWVRDGQRFGWQTISDVEVDAVKMGEDVYVCPSCGTENPATGEGAFGVAARTCQQCGAQLTDEDLKPAEYVAVPKATNERRIPKGAAMFTLVPGLQLHSPPWANEMHEFPYMQWNLEVHKAQLKAAYPDAASKIKGGAPPGADDQQMRVWRLMLQQGFPIQMPGDVLANLVTFSRTWIRPWAFWDVEDDGVRETLLDLFPDGAYIAFAGEAFCEARNESMDSCWEVDHAMEGDGQNRPSVGDSLIDVNRRINDLDNIEQETACYGIPVTFADNEMVNADALSKNPARPGQVLPVKTRPGVPVAQGIFATPLAEVSPQMVARRQELAGPVMQRLSGIQPALYGGELPGSDTLGQYAMAREQGMQRIGLFYRRFKNFYGRVHLKGVMCWRENAPEDAEIPTEREGGGFESKYIRKAELQGNIEIYEESDESYPALPSEVKSIALQMLNDEVIGPMLAKEPSNISQIKEMTGMTDFVTPGDDQRIIVLRAIGNILEGMPEGPDPDRDDGAVCMTEIQRWMRSDAGQQAFTENPNFQLVRNYYHACQQLAQQQQQKASVQKPPSESMNFKDLPPDGQAQMAAQAGIQLNPMDLAAREQQDKAEKSAQAAAKIAAMHKGEQAQQ